MQCPPNELAVGGTLWAAYLGTSSGKNLKALSSGFGAA